MKRIPDKWFDQWIQTDSYLASDGTVNRLPLRLSSSNVIIYGEANISEVMKEFEHENFQPVTVGGKVPVQLWCNNFIDTDCGPSDATNPYIETWFSFPVTQESRTLDLPYENPFSYNVDAPDTYTWCHRVLCGPAKDGYSVAAIAAISGGREIWGFPKHPALADLNFEYYESDYVSFRARHQGNEVLFLSISLPEKSPDNIIIEADQLTPKGSCLTPKQNPLKPTFVAKQTRYTQAFIATMNFSNWDNDTDTLEIYSDESYFGGLLYSWQFKPVLKMHTSNLRIVAFKPEGWKQHK
tara:strand:- start:1021 stop:1908 length:888 start_codon:yes stop_codon:yes gene_type:complete